MKHIMLDTKNKTLWNTEMEKERNLINTINKCCIMNNMLPCTNKITIRNIKWMIITTKQKILTIIIMNLFNKTIKFILTNNIIINIKVK